MFFTARLSLGALKQNEPSFNRQATPFIVTSTTPLFTNSSSSEPSTPSLLLPGLSVMAALARFGNVSVGESKTVATEPDAFAVAAALLQSDTVEGSFPDTACCAAGFSGACSAAWVHMLMTKYVA